MSAMQIEMQDTNCPGQVKDMSRTPLTEAEARLELERYERGGKKRPAMRALAEEWHWSKSTVARFLSQIDGMGDTGPAAASTNVFVEMQTTARITETPDGLKIERGPDLFIPRSDLDKIDRIAADMRAEEDAHRPVKTTDPDDRKSGGSPVDISDHEGEETLIRAQAKITIEYNNAAGVWVLTQHDWPNDDVEIHINAENADEFLDALCDAFRVGGSPR